MCVQFLLHLLQLLTVSAEGRNKFTEVQCHAILPCAELVEAAASIPSLQNPVIKVRGRCCCSVPSLFCV